MPRKAQPKTPGGVVDAIWKLDQEIKKINDQLAAKKKERESLIDHAFSTFENQDLESARGKLAQGTISRQVVPQIEDPAQWDKLFKWILKTKDFSVLQKRLGTTHIKELWDDKKKIPGVVPFTKVSMSVRKVKAK